MRTLPPAARPYPLPIDIGALRIAPAPACLTIQSAEGVASPATVGAANFHRCLYRPRPVGRNRGIGNAAPRDWRIHFAACVPYEVLAASARLASLCRLHGSGLSFPWLASSLLSRSLSNRTLTPGRLSRPYFALSLAGLPAFAGARTRTPCACAWVWGLLVLCLYI